MIRAERRQPPVFRRHSPRVQRPSQPAALRTTITLVIRDSDIRRIEVIDEPTAAMYRCMSPMQRIRLGLGIREFAERTAAAGIRAQHPAWNDAQVRDEVRRRLTRAAG